MFFFYLLYKGQKLTDWELWRNIAAGLGTIAGVARYIYTDLRKWIVDLYYPTVGFYLNSNLDQCSHVRKYEDILSFEGV